jgi:hypothetical protein
MPIAISRTSPFRFFQSRIGSATYRLNTILVGLEHIANGGDKIGNLPVTWKKPVGSESARQVADQAKIFACSGAIALAGDVIDYFIRDIVREGWLGFSVQTVEIATKAVTRVSALGGAYSVADRAGAICSELTLNEPIGMAALELFSKWRNITVHSEDRATVITTANRNLLLQSEKLFYDNYSHFDIGLALDNFEKRKLPVPKEVSSLIALAQNICRKIDEASIKRVAGNSNQIEKIADILLKEYFQIERINSKSSWQELSDICQGDDLLRRSKLLKIFQQVGLTETKKPISAELNDQYICDLLTLDRDKFARRFSVAKT